MPCCFSLPYSLACGAHTPASPSTSRQIDHWPVAGSGRAVTRLGLGRRARLTRGSCRPRVPVGLTMPADSRVLPATICHECLIHPDSGNSRRNMAGAASTAPHLEQIKGPVWMQQAKWEHTRNRMSSNPMCRKPATGPGDLRWFPA